MADKNVPSAEQKELKVVESKKKVKKEPVSIKKIITVVIISVLALLMIGGAYYIVVMINQAKAEKDSAWGSYNGEPIVLENNNVFYNALVNSSDFMNAQLTGDYNSLLTCYSNAYQQQVAFVALSQEADKSGILAPQDLVDNLILAAGVYNGEDGSFSEEVFNSASDASKTSVNTYYTNYYPYQQVVTDLQTSIISEQELAFITEVAGWTRSFEYFVINFNAYPDKLAEAYGKENPEFFATADISVLTTTTLDSGNAAYEALQLGSTWEEVVSSYSEDNYKDAAGAVGEMQLFAIASNMSTAEDIQLLTALKAGEYTAPIQGPYGYAIYKLNSDVKEADFTSDLTLSAIKYYIDANDIDDVTPYIDEALGNATALAQTDFEGAAESVNSSVEVVTYSANNVGGSSYLGGVSYYDATGYLASAVEDKAVARELFTADEGYVTGSIAVSSSENTYIVAKVDSIDNENASMSSIANMYYAYYAASQPVYDAIYAAFNSSKFEDNFYAQFFASLYSN